MAPVDNRKLERAAKRAARKASREAAAAHNARVLADRERSAAELAAHIARWGEDGFECA